MRRGRQAVVEDWASRRLLMECGEEAGPVR